MRRNAFLASILFSFAVACCSCAGEAAKPADAPTPTPAPAPAAAKGPNAILIVWDGLDRSVVQELLKADKLPNLAALIKAGSLQDIDVKGHETETRPGHAEMFTGLSAEVTGVKSNHEGENVPEGTTIFERIKAAHDKDAVAAIMVTGKAYVGALVPERSRGKFDVFDAGTRTASTVGPLALAALVKYKEQRFVALFHFLDPDSAGHGFGSDSQEYRKAGMICDQWLGLIVEQLKKNKVDENTLIYVMADHGFDKSARVHHNAPHSWLATNDPKVGHGGTIGDVPATILERFGVDPAKLKPELIGKPLTGKGDAEKKAPAAQPEKTPEPAPVAPAAK